MPPVRSPGVAFAATPAPGTCAPKRIERQWARCPEEEGPTDTVAHATRRHGSLTCGMNSETRIRTGAESVSPASAGVVGAH